MFRVLSVLNNKNKLERINRRKRDEELLNLRLELAYRAKLNDDMKIVDLILEDGNVKEVIVKVPDRYITKFMKAIYSEEMAQYTIIQLDELRFSISNKIVNF